MKIIDWFAKRVGELSPVWGGRDASWWPTIREPFTGAWQRNIEWTTDTVLAHHAVYACVTLIANDIGKLRERFVEQDKDGVWTEATSAAFSPVLRRPNRYQNHIQFKQWWITSKLIRGNAYALKARDNRGIVTSLYLLDPMKVKPMVSTDGSLFYQLGADNLGNVSDPDGITVPASEIIHDRMNCLFHPLVGVSPIFASGAAANIGISIQKNSAKFFANDSNPGGILTVPGSIPAEKAAELKDKWNTNYGGDNGSKVAILADGMKYIPMRMSAVESQLIEQMRWTAEIVCSVFHIPPYKIGVGALPSYQNIEALQQDYYSACLQSLIEEYEACKDEGLGLEDKIDGVQKGVELDLDGLLRMDTSSLHEVLREDIRGGVITTDEARKKLDLKPVKGGDVIWRQQQDYSLEALAERDKDDPFGKKPQPVQALPPPDDEDEPAKLAAALIKLFETA